MKFSNFFSPSKQEKPAEYYDHLQSASLKVWNALLAANPQETADDKDWKAGKKMVEKIVYTPDFNGDYMLQYLPAEETLTAKFGRNYWSLVANVALTHEEAKTIQDIPRVINAALGEYEYKAARDYVGDTTEIKQSRSNDGSWSVKLPLQTTHDPDSFIVLLRQQTESIRQKILYYSTKAGLNRLSTGNISR